ncbi:MAG: hypothetical protein JST59_00055 [Actinobacteria bacterium]|nr:hypothetical protein [Actinomycetota bacterium]
MELKKLCRTTGLTTTQEWANLIGCFPIRFEADLLLKNFPKCIAVRTLYSEDDLRLSVYCLPKGVVMPIHDHPSMFVMSYVLFGEMFARTYTRMGKDVFKKESRTLKKNEYMVIEGERHNLHEMTGVENTLFLDIIFPDYNYSSRQCTHYEEPPSQPGDMVRLKVVEEPDYEMTEF